MTHTSFSPRRRTVVLGLGGAGALAMAVPARLAQAMGAGHATSHAVTPYKGATELAAVDALPQGLPLRALPRLPNRARRKGLFRSQLVAAQATLRLLEKGPPTKALAYNGMLPGPLLEVWEGDRVEIDFFNQLHQPSTVHWHGLAIPADQDGAPQDVVEAGRRRLYHFTLPRGSAGTHWYHPHPHMLTAEQVYRGLAGGIIVRAKDDPLAPLREQELLISDLRLARDGGIPPNDREDWMNGREGQFVLINGQHLPRVKLYGTERWRIWNACSARYLRLSLDGLPFTLVGTDGGLLGAPQRDVTELLLAPAERAEIVVTAAQQKQAVLVAEPYDRGAMGRLAGPSPRRVLAHIEMQRSATVTRIPEVLRPIEPLGEPTAEHLAAFSDAVDLEVQASAANPFERPTDMQFLLNGQTYDLERVDVEGKLGAVEEWTLVNASTMGMDHPFHIHGGHFQVLDRTFEGETRPEPFLAWRDTVNLRAGESARMRMRITEPGLRMFHCHILEHEDLGMMGNLLVR